MTNNNQLENDQFLQDQRYSTKNVDSIRWGTNCNGRYKLN